FNKSFASSDKVDSFSEKNKINTRDIFKCSNKEFIFECDKCDHEFTKSLNNIKIGRFCPYCSSTKLCDDECITCEEKSFASSDKAKFLSKKNPIGTDARQIFKYSNKKYIFDCEKCKHELNTSPVSISRGRWCVYCANQELCSDQNCQICKK